MYIFFVQKKLELDTKVKLRCTILLLKLLRGSSEYILLINFINYFTTCTALRLHLCSHS